MPVSPLESLVQGLQENREAQRKKALDVANQEADKFERQYKLDQAKQQAQYQHDELEIRKKEQERLTQEEMRRAAKDLDTKEYQKSLMEWHKKGLDLKDKLAASGNDTKKKITIMQEWGRDYREALKGAAGPEQADAIAAHARAVFPEFLNSPLSQDVSQGQGQQPGSPQPPGQAPAPGGSQGKPEYGSLDYLNSLMKPAGQAGQAGPASAMGPLPLPAQRQKASEATTGLRIAQRIQIEKMTQADELYKWAQISHLAAETNQTNVNAALAPIKEEHEFIRATWAEATKANSVRLEREKFTEQLKNNYAERLEKFQGSIKDKADIDIKLQKDITKFATEKTTLAKEVNKLMSEMSATKQLATLDPHDLLSQTDPTTNRPYDIRRAQQYITSIQDLYNNQKGHFQELLFLQRLNDGALLRGENARMKAGMVILQDSSGKPSKSETDKAIEANNKAIEESDELLRQLKSQIDEGQKKLKALQDEARSNAAPVPTVTLPGLPGFAPKKVQVKPGDKIDTGPGSSNPPLGYDRYTPGRSAPIRKPVRKPVHKASEEHLPAHAERKAAPVLPKKKEKARTLKLKGGSTLKIERIPD